MTTTAASRIRSGFLRIPWGPIAAAAISLLALVETVSAWVAPGRAPSDADWSAAAAVVRRDFRPGDLIVAAPDWADDVLRLHLGDLIPVAMVARLDDARYGRVWEISQRGARAAEGRGTVGQELLAGALTIRRHDRPPAVVNTDFFDAWAHARVSRREPGRGDIPCERQSDRFQCPDLGFNFVAPGVLEIGNTLRRALYVQPVGGAKVVVEFPSVTLGNELAVAGGLHHVWLRKAGDGSVELDVFVNGTRVLTRTSDNRSGWTVDRVDTSVQAGTTANVRFEVSSARPYSRHFGFAAEARTR